VSAKRGGTARELVHRVNREQSALGCFNTLACADGRQACSMLCDAEAAAIEADRASRDREEAARLSAAIETTVAVAERETLRYVAAYLLDRGDQYDTKSPCWIALADAAHAIAEGEFDAARAHGEIDEGDVLARVDKWIQRAKARAAALSQQKEG
jgi:regulator of protease activity HflC (stomatin/prohibitin superfamily)